MAKYCFARRVARAVSIWAVLAVLSAATTRAADARMTANDCLSFDQRDGEKELLYHAQNACEHELDCRMSYTLRCEDSKGNVTSSAARQLSFALSKNGSRELTLSAKQCQQGWTIADVNWSCF